jgi:hypothetical protein
MSFYISTTGTVQSIIINDIIKPVSINHPSVHLDLEKLIPINEINNSNDITNAMSSGSIIFEGNSLDSLSTNNINGVVIASIRDTIAKPLNAKIVQGDNIIITLEENEDGSKYLKISANAITSYSDERIDIISGLVNGLADGINDTFILAYELKVKTDKVYDGSFLLINTNNSDYDLLEITPGGPKTKLKFKPAKIPDNGAVITVMGTRKA